MNCERITWRKQLTGMAFAAPYLVGFTVFLAIPLVMALYFSCCEYNLLDRPEWIGLTNYRNLLGDAAFRKVLKNTLVYAAASVPLTLSASVLLAVLLNQSIRCRPLFRTIIFMPTLVPEVVAGLLWQWILNGRQGLLNVALGGLFGWINRPLEWLGLPTLPTSLPNWLGNENLVMPIIVLLSLWGIGNAVVIFLAGLQNIPVELYEAAEIDGASAPRRLWHITLPMLSPVIFFNLVMGIIAAWQVFAIPYILIGDRTNRAGYFYSMYLVDSTFNQYRAGAASAMAWIQFVIILTLTLAVVRSSRRWVHYR